MTKKDISSKVTLSRASTFFAVFSVGVLAIELIRTLTPHRSALATSLCLALIIILALAGALFLNERTILSRVTSGCTLLILGFIGLTFSTFPAYLLPLAMGIAYTGSLSVLHRQSRRPSLVALYGIYVFLATLLFIVAFVYGMTFLNNILLRTNL